jgi:hypothetical protein
VHAARPVDEDVAVVEVRERDTARVERGHDRREAVEARRRDGSLGACGERMRVDPVRGQRVRTDAPEKARKSGDAYGRTVGPRLAPQQEAADRVPDPPRARRVVLERDPARGRLADDEVGLRPVAPGAALDRPQPRGVDRRPAPDRGNLCPVGGHR